MLPTHPDDQTARRIIDHQPDEYWYKVIAEVASRHQLATSGWKRVQKGSNVIFRQGMLALKIVPPNWGYQAQAEVESLTYLTAVLPLELPKLIAHGELNNWPYVVITWLPGISLGDVWQDLTMNNKKLILGQVGEFARDLHASKIDLGCALNKNWHQYHQTLLNNCLPRHKGNALPDHLARQIGDYLGENSEYFDDGQTLFTHMDLHPWNLMVEEHGNEFRLCGVLDFGDAIIGRSRLLELATPLIFLCQGSRELARELLQSYGHYQVSESTQHDLMAVALIRPDCDLNFVLTQVPESGPRDNWQQIAAQLFPV
jgi:hygromycin-B 7''-O-kinase